MLLKKHRAIIGVFICVAFIAMNVAAFLTRNPVLSLSCFWFAGVAALAIMYFCLKTTIHMAKIAFTKHDAIRILIALFVSFLIYLILLTSKHSIYTWDSVVYYNMMGNLLQQFQIHNIAGFSEWFISGLTYDYGDFLQIFVYPFYAFSNHTIEAYILSYFLGTVIPVIISLYIACMAVIKKVSSEELHQCWYIKTTVLSVLVLFPLLHGAAVNGQPDIAGLIFVGMIIALTVDYDFSQRDIKRWLMLLFATIALVLTRRWYLFFVVSYYLTYVTLTLLVLLFGRRFDTFKKSLLNILIFGSSSIVIAIVVLFKMVIRILGNQYSESYAAWNRGGISYEPINQLRFIGICVAILVVAGLIYGLLNKQSRKTTCTMLMTYIVEMILFTRIQNAGYHQSLIFVPFYLYCIVLLSVFLSKKNRKFGAAGCAAVTVVLLCTFVYSSCFPFENNVGDALLGKVDIYPETRSDMKEIGVLVDFLTEKADTDNKVMFLAGSNTYDCATFINYPTPNANGDVFFANNFYAASEGFPEEFLTAKYIVVIDPIKQREAIISEGVLSTLKQAFFEDKTISSRFYCIGEFELAGSAKAVVYERIVQYDSEEINALISDFSYYCDRYPKVFLNKLQSMK